MTSNWTSYFQKKLPQFTEELRKWVELESPTRDKEAVDRLGAVIAERFRELGCKVEVIEQSACGNPLRMEYGEGEEQILVLGHFDTVKEVGTIQREPWRIEAGRLYGPGTYDMKAGIAFAYFALRAIVEEKLAPGSRLVFFWNTDEETGSKWSHQLIMEEAKRSKAVLVLEPAAANGALKTSRKGCGEFVLEVSGRASHAGNDHVKGINAIEELAHHILAIQSWTDYERGTTLSVGTVKGGSATNVVPGWAEATVDVRVKTAREAERIEQLMSRLSPVISGASVRVQGGITSPPMERTEGTARLFAIAQEQARLEGFELQETSVGGASDGNFAAAAGAAVLDGLGATGDGAHAAHEHILLDEVPQRIALLLRLFLTL